MKPKVGILFLVLAALISTGTAIAHLSCLYFGPECYAVQMAPTFLVESAKNGTYLAPVLNIFVSTIFLIWGIYALSAARIIRKLPLMKLAIYAIATVCIIRGILPLQLWLRFPERVNDVAIIVGIIWLMTGLFYLIGNIMRKKQSTN